jgi:hypothetical protein
MAASRELFPLPELPSTMVNFPRRNPTSEIMLEWLKIFFFLKGLSLQIELIKYIKNDLGAIKAGDSKHHLILKRTSFLILI